MAAAFPISSKNYPKPQAFVAKDPLWIVTARDYGAIE